MFLSREHLGLLQSDCHTHETDSKADVDVEDPICEEFYSMWRKTAERNMTIFETVRAVVAFVTMVTLSAIKIAMVTVVLVAP